jgi:peptidyl-prolyl cis-trans isomerase A (cyclophilin A)
MTNASFLSTSLAVVLVVATASVSAGQKTGRATGQKPAAAKQTAPATYRVNFDTSAGTFVVEVHRDWARHGADRFYTLVSKRFYDNCRFFRVIPDFMVQFGISGDPAVSKVWREAPLPVDPVKQSNKRGFITYAMAGRPDTRTTQVFINFRDNVNLDAQGFAPFGQVVSGMEVVDKIYSGYGEGAPRGKGPDQERLQAEGNAYLMKEFPKLDYIKQARLAK